MPRFKQTVESAAALAADTTFANLVAGAAANFKLRRVILGCRAGAAVPTSQQVEVECVRATARGTATATGTGLAMDPRSAVSAITGLDTTWSVVPTLAASDLDRWTFNTQSGMDIPAELLEEMICDQGTANGLAFRNKANALPAGHILTLTVEWEE
jgi:hypothetical protein